MKTKDLKTILLALLTFLFVLPASSQKGIEDGSKYGKGQDSINCIRNLSLYREFFKQSNYRDAIGSWRVVFGECPASSEQMYVDGINMYRSLIGAAQVPDRVNQLVDTMMMIYDRRAEYFSGEGNILGRKGIDLLRYRSSDVDAMEEAYGYLKRSIELEANRSRDAVMITFVNASITLNKAGRIDDDQSIEDYFMVTAIVDQLLGSSSRWANAKANIDDLMLNSGLLTCEALNSYFEPQYQANQDDEEFLQKVVDFYSASGCDRADLYVDASEKIYEINPGPESAHNLAILFIAKNDFQKAANYLSLAVVGMDIESSTRADWQYELAVVSMANNDFCDAILWTREATANNPNHGKAYIAMGDAVIAVRETLGEDFEQRTAFWVAADYYEKAKSVDPSVAQEANRKLRDYAGQYPNNEEIFFRDLKEGDSYRVGGCINETTTVRARE